MNAAPELAPPVFVLDLFLLVDSFYQTCLFVSGLRQKVKAIRPSLRRSRGPALQYSLHTTIQQTWIEPTASLSWWFYISSSAALAAGLGTESVSRARLRADI